MKILVVTGSVSTPIDGVREITNSATGKTGAAIAIEASRRGHQGVLLTSAPVHSIPSGWKLANFADFGDLQTNLEALVGDNRFDAVVMAAAICDYVVSGYCQNLGGEVHPIRGKVPGHFPEIWLKLVPAPRLADQLRHEWGFAGKMVIFKLESGISLDELFERAEQARGRCLANLVVANLLETAHEVAWLGPTAQGEYIQVERGNLASQLLEALESGVFP